MKAKKEASWMDGILFALAVSSILRITGGIRSLSTWGQILALIMIPIVMFGLTKKNKEKLTKFQLHYIYNFDILFSITSIIAIIAVIIRESFYYIWYKYTIYIKVILAIVAFVPGIYVLVCTMIDPDIKRTWF
ncbi:hypothetical protein IAI10_06120 [Clostridium sp. 19966]|uniref:hypothetical protein n=1 Tax=Clostridium sp. 19966 TaxID=2768166 RepID=UPI0028DE2B1A|nr:hypothetical protein [Clostridium sp. 19966]MDT8716226.1 hypothetical protein [Clostridium sp. 19966]